MLEFDPLFSPLTVALLTGGAMLAAVWACRSAPPELGRRTRLAATVLRLLAVAAVALILLRPRIVHETVLHQKRPCAILLDTSRSMTFTDEAGGRTRLAVAQEILAENRRLVERLRLRYTLRTYGFAERAGAVNLAAFAARGKQTNIAGALARAARDFRGDEAAGILILSDGSHNAAAELAAVVALLRRENVPVFAVGLGSEKAGEGHQDVAVRSVDCARRAFVGNRLPVTAQVHYVGPRSARTAVVLREGDREVGRRLVAFGRGPAVEQVRFEYVAREMGFRTLTVVASPLPGEANTANNAQSTVVRVASARLVVFYLEGRIRPEFKFIRRSLGAAANLELLAVNAFLAGSDGVAGVLPDEKTWARINVVILGDVAARDLGKAAMARLRKFVSEGGGLLMLGGERSFGAGGYAGTALADALPVRLSSGDGHDGAVFAPRPSEAGAEHPITRLAEKPKENAATWAALPKLRGCNRVKGIKPNAATLLEGPGGRPVLVVQEYGRGRSAALTVDATWRWAFSPKPATEQHRRFWRQLVLWLARSDYSRQQAVAVSTDRARYAAGSRPAITAVVQRVSDAIAKAQVVAIVKAPRGPLPPFRLGRGVGTHRMVLPTPLAETGEYRLTVEARGDDGKPIASDDTVFLVHDIDAESETPLANLALLRRLAHQTGGGFFTAAEASEAFKRLLRRKPPAELTRRHRRPLAASGAALGGLLALFLAALTGDWVLRKRKGLA